MRDRVSPQTHVMKPGAVRNTATVAAKRDSPIEGRVIGLWKYRARRVQVRNQCFVEKGSHLDMEQRRESCLQYGISNGGDLIGSIGHQIVTGELQLDQEGPP